MKHSYIAQNKHFHNSNSSEGADPEGRISEFNESLIATSSMHVYGHAGTATRSGPKSMSGSDYRSQVVIFLSYARALLDSALHAFKVIIYTLRLLHSARRFVITDYCKVGTLIFIM